MEVYVEQGRLKLYASNYCFEDKDFSDIRNTNFRRASFRDGKYRGARFEDMVFDQTAFYNVTLDDVIFRECVFRSVKFANIDLSYCTFINCYFVECEFVNTIGTKVGTFVDDGQFKYIQNTVMPYIPMSCPDEGAFFGYKKVRIMRDNEAFPGIAKLYIPEEAARSSSTGRKCRCQFARVMSITGATPSTENEEFEEATSYFDHHFHYRAGHMVYADAWDENRWNECSNGIHFFMNRKEAINY